MGEEVRRYELTGVGEVQDVPDGYVVYHAGTEKVHYLNPTAAIVYELCGERQTASAIAAYLRTAFSLPELPSDEVASCIAMLEKEGLVRPCA